MNDFPWDSESHDFKLEIFRLKLSSFKLEMFRLKLSSLELKCEEKNEDLRLGTAEACWADVTDPNPSAINKDAVTLWHHGDISLATFPSYSIQFISKLA